MNCPRSFTPQTAEGEPGPGLIVPLIPHHFEKSDLTLALLRLSNSCEQVLRDLNVLLSQAFESLDLDNAFVPSEQFEFLKASGDVVPGTRIETLRFTGELGKLQQSILEADLLSNGAILIPFDVFEKLLPSGKSAWGRCGDEIQKNIPPKIRDNHYLTLPAGAGDTAVGQVISRLLNGVLLPKLRAMRIVEHVNTSSLHCYPDKTASFCLHSDRGFESHCQESMRREILTLVHIGHPLVWLQYKQEKDSGSIQRAVRTSGSVMSMCPKSRVLQHGATEVKGSGMGHLFKWYLFENIDPNDPAISNLILRAMLLITHAAIVEVGVHAGLPDYAPALQVVPDWNSFRPSDYSFFGRQRLGVPLSASHKANISESLLGVPHSASHKANISESLLGHPSKCLGVPLSASHKANIINAKISPATILAKQQLLSDGFTFADCRWRHTLTGCSWLTSHTGAQIQKPKKFWNTFWSKLRLDDWTIIEKADESSKSALLKHKLSLKIFKTSSPWANILKHQDEQHALHFRQCKLPWG